MNSVRAFRAEAAVWVLGGLPKVMLVIALLLEKLLAGSVRRRSRSNPHNLASTKGEKLMKRLRFILDIVVLLGEIALVGTQP